MGTNLNLAVTLAGAGIPSLRYDKRVSGKTGLGPHAYGRGIDFHLYLLFFHRRLRRLVAIELKVGDFQPEYKGQMELYLRWLDKYERQPNEESTIGLILCTGKNHECIELLELGKSGIHVAEHLTTLPSKEALRQKLQQASKRARLRVESQSYER